MKNDKDFLDILKEVKNSKENEYIEKSVKIHLPKVLLDVIFALVKKASKIGRAHV